MSLDFQKREAIQCRWDLDGAHTPKKARNKGKGRGKDKALIRAQLNYDSDADIDAQIAWERELQEAWDCHEFGPCEPCLAKEEENGSSNNGR